MYTARRFEEETALYHYRRRTYDPNKGRFMQRDPLGYVDGLGLYVYAHARVTLFIDPLGTDDQVEVKIHIQPGPTYSASESGHASLELEPGDIVGLHPIWPISAIEFLISENAALPMVDNDEVAGAEDLNTISIKVSAANFAKMKQRRMVLTKQWWEDPVNFSVWNNCCDFIVDILRAGGLPIDHRLTPWSPDALQDALENLEEPPSSFTAPWTPHGGRSYSSPTTGLVTHA